MNPWHDCEDFAREARKVDSVGEALLLTLLWWRRDGWTVRTQEPIEQYRVDLFVPEAGVAIEVDSLAGHGSNAAMERDAKKRNLVVARGWAPLTFSAQQTIFDSHETLAHALAVIGSRLHRPRPESPPRATRPAFDAVTFAAGGRGLLAALEGTDDGTLRLSPSLREMANRSPAEKAGVELLGIVLEAPTLVREREILDALLAAGGPVKLAAEALLVAVAGEAFDRAGFLRDCPAMLQPFAVARLGAPWSQPATARERALALLRGRRAA